LILAILIAGLFLSALVATERKTFRKPMYVLCSRRAAARNLNAREIAREK
jgi:hypothetical protein